MNFQDIFVCFDFWLISWQKLNLHLVWVWQWFWLEWHISWQSLHGQYSQVGWYCIATIISWAAYLDIINITPPRLNLISIKIKFIYASFQFQKAPNGFDKEVLFYWLICKWNNKVVTLLYAGNLCLNDSGGEDFQLWTLDVLEHT